MDAVSGLAFILFVMSSGAGGVPTDIVSLIEPSDYFAARRVDGGVKRLLELASASPTDTRGGLQQLLAIRWLGEAKDRLGEHKEAVRAALDRLARGADGFGRDYARVALARIDGKPVPVLHRFPKESLREGLAWFPADTNLAGILDRRAPPGKADQELGAQFRHVWALFLKIVPDQAFREELYRFAEAVGNLRFDRLAFGFAPLAESPRKGRLFLRMTGRMDHKRFAAYLRGKFSRDSTFIEKKGERGEAITIVAPKDQPPAFALVGDSDLVMAGYLEDFVDCTSIVQEVLAVRAGGRPSLLESPLGKLPREARPDARSLVGGSLPRDVIPVIARSPFGAAPERFAADLLASPGAGFDLRLRATFDSAADARRFAAGTREQIEQVLEALKDLPPVAQPSAAAVRKTLQGIEVKTDRAEVTVRAQVSAATCKALLSMAEATLSSNRPSGGKVPHE